MALQIIENGTNGIIVPVKNVKALYNAMLILLINTNTRGKMAECSREIIVKRYDQSFVLQELLKEYTSLCNNRFSQVTSLKTVD